MTTIPMHPPLFSRAGLNIYLGGRLQDAQQAVQAMDPDRLLQTPEHDLAEQITEHFTVECPMLNRTGIYGLASETGYHPVPNGFSDSFRQAIQVRPYVVPFTGDAKVFDLQASQFSTAPPPQAQVSAGPDGGGELQIALVAPHGQLGNAEQIRHTLHAALDKIDQYLSWAEVDINAYTGNLRGVTAAIATRKADILRERDLEAEIGFPVHRRSDANSFAVPVRRKTIVTTRRPDPSAPFAPQPMLADDAYEAALDVLAASRNALERSPSTVKKFSEMMLRDTLLVNLNAQFEGEAAGEVFNGKGKTDILIRDKDRNVFIGECKIWSGPQAFSNALDQLLGYLVWRDTKAALILFIRGGNPTEIINKSLATISGHQNYKRTVRVGASGDRSDFIVRSTHDPDRDIQLAFLPFILPSA